jgi:hypothetical protein
MLSARKASRLVRLAMTNPCRQPCLCHKTANCAAVLRRRSSWLTAIGAGTSGSGTSLREEEEHGARPSVELIEIHSRWPALGSQLAARGSRTEESLAKPLALSCLMPLSRAIHQPIGGELLLELLNSRQPTRPAIWFKYLLRYPDCSLWALKDSLETGRDVYIYDGLYQAV